MAYFNYDRKLRALEDINTCYECAEKAGIKDKLFINFGVLLGIVREHDFIANDDDVDMCVQSDNITKEQQDIYMDCLKQKGMFFARKKVARRGDTGMAVWFTLRRKADRAKFCHWWGYEWQNYWWWSKGRKWVRPNKFDKNKWKYEDGCEAIALGVPASYVRKLVQIDFKGIKVRIPERYGSVLDWEYPGWPIPKSGSSKHQVVCIIPKWSNSRLWKVKSTTVL